MQRRYRAYRCVVCGAYHLTSGRGERTEPEPPRKEPPGPRLGDLDWSAVLDPKPKRLSPQPPLQEGPLGEGEPDTARPCPPEGSRTARCAGSPGKDGRVLLVVAGRLVKSRPVDRALRATLKEGVCVTVEGDPPTVVTLARWDR